MMMLSALSHTTATHRTPLAPHALNTVPISLDRPANSLGHARVVHKLGLFYYALVDLSPASRQQLHFITPFTVCKAKDVSRYGCKILHGDPDSTWYGTCTSLGASLKRMSDTAVTPVLWTLPIHTKAMQVQIQLFVLVVAADHPAAAVLGCWARSVSARRFDRRSMVDRKQDWKRPNSYLNDNHDLPQLWDLRTSELLEEHERMYESMKSEEGVTEAAEFLRSIGVNGDCCFNYPLKPIPHLRVVECQPQDGMHTYLVASGLCSLELAAFIYLAHRAGVFTVEAFNAALASRRFGGSRLPPIYETVKEGQTGGLPKQNAHTHWNAGQQLHFMPSSLEVLEPLVQQGMQVARDDIALMPTKKRFKFNALLEDFKRAWLSWKALHSEVAAAFSTSFTHASVVDLDRLIYTHHTCFLAVDAYRNAELWKPKHNFAQLITIDILLFGPMVGYWCMRFEGMNKIMKRFVTSGNWADVCKRGLQMWELTTAWGLSKGNFGGSFAPVLSLKEGPGIVSMRDDPQEHMVVSLFESAAFKGFEELEYFHVYEVQYMGQNLRPEMWVMAERWSEWMDNSSPRLAKLGQMLRVASGEIFVRLHVLLHVDLALKWTGPRELALDRSEIVPENLIVFDRLLDEMAITHVTLSATGDDDDRVRATVRQSTLG